VISPSEFFISRGVLLSEGISAVRLSLLLISGVSANANREEVFTRHCNAAISLLVLFEEISQGLAQLFPPIFVESINQGFHRAK
jgi:hypothetical protein